MTTSLWVKQARNNFLHPYIVSFLDQYPHVWAEADEDKWMEVHGLLGSLDDMEVGLDSDCVLQPLLLKALGPTLSLMFFEFCQTRMHGQQVEQIFGGQFYGTVEDEEVLSPLVDSLMFVFFHILRTMETDGIPASNWAEVLDVSGRSAVLNLFKWIKLYVLKNDVLRENMLAWGGAEWWGKVRVMAQDKRLQKMLDGW